jgi:mono/diheme cytochrome c family protein
MLTLVFILFWVVLGVGLVIVALSGGPGGALSRLQSQTRTGRRAALAIFALTLVLLGIVVPAAVIAAADSRNDIPEADVSNLTASEKHGRELFARRCSICHTLQAVNAVAQVGPDLDTVRPNKALVLDALAKGRARGNGQMAADLYVGRDAEDVAAFVAKAVGQTGGGASQ